MLIALLVDHGEATVVGVDRLEPSGLMSRSATVDFPTPDMPVSRIALRSRDYRHQAEETRPAGCAGARASEVEHLEVQPDDRGEQAPGGIPLHERGRAAR